jgi:hypothetical protein
MLISIHLDFSIEQREIILLTIVSLVKFISISHKIRVSSNVL